MTTIKKTTSALLLLTWVLTATPAAGGPSATKHYDEIFDESGEVRPHYAEVWKIYSRIPKKKREELKAKSVKDFRGDNALLSLPRVVPQAEFEEVLKKGIEQRGTALRMFIQDYYSGKRKAVKAGIISQAVMDRVLERAGEQDVAKYMNPDTTSFWYGPDTIRDSEGNHRIVEDNPGYIGGLGDLRMARESILNSVPKYGDVLESESPEEFYRKVIERYRARANPPNGKIVLIEYDRASQGDEEEGRIRKIFEDYGVEIVLINPHNPKDARLKKRLVTTETGVWLERKTANGHRVRERVGMVMACTEPFDVDPQHPAMRRQKILSDGRNILYHENEVKKWAAAYEDFMEKMKLKLADPLITAKGEREIKNDIKSVDHFRKYKAARDKVRMKLEKLMESGETEAIEAYLRKAFAGAHSLDGVGVPGLLDAIMKNKVSANVTAGTEFIGDKEFYMYVDDLIKFYLGEEPLVPNMPTASMGKDGALDAKLFKKVFESLDKYVIKKVDGRGGSEVWIGPKMSAEEIVKVKELIKNNPEAYIAQRYTAISTLDGYIVDLRVLSDVGPTDVQVSGTPWGRAAPVDGDGKVNISLRGSETAVFVVRDPNACAVESNEALLGDR